MKALLREDNADPKFIAHLDAAGGRYIHVRVSADGSAFTVRINDEGETKTFATK